MKKVKHVVAGAAGDTHYGYRFQCPGCDEAHVIPTKPHPQGWDFNDDLERPTFGPSILLYSHGCLLPDGTQGMTPRCHSFVREGRIEYLSDCGHHLAGQTVELPDIA